MTVLLRCPDCGTTRTTPGTCEACHAAQVRYFCTNHKPGLWLDAPTCKECGARFGDPPRRTSVPPPVASTAKSARPPAVARKRPAISTPPAYSPRRSPPPVPARTSPGAWSRPERTPPFELGAAGGPLWLTLLRNVILARRRPAGDLPERDKPRRGVGGCLLRAFLLLVMLFLGLVAMLVVFGWSMLEGY